MKCDLRVWSQILCIREPLVSNVSQTGWSLGQCKHPLLFDLRLARLQCQKQSTQRKPKLSISTHFRRIELEDNYIKPKWCGGRKCIVCMFQDQGIWGVTVTKADSLITEDSSTQLLKGRNARKKHPQNCSNWFWYFLKVTRSCAALRAADLDWIVGPGYRHRHKTWQTRGHNWHGRGAGQE